MPTQELPNNPSLENLRKQAKSLRKAVLAKDSAAVARVREFHPRADERLGAFSLSDAQLVIARSYDFSSWTKLKQYVDAVSEHFFLPPEISKADADEPLVDRFIRLACLDYRTDHAHRRVLARQLFSEHPTLAHENIYAAAVVGDVNTVRRMLRENPKLARSRGGPHHWEPLLYACYSRLNSDVKEHSKLTVARILL
jgi:hypothetical protein